MKYELEVLLRICIFFVGVIVGVLIKQPEPIEPPKPKLTMDLVCVTPHGHQVYSYIDEKNFSTRVYVVLRHSDGYPLGIAVEE